MHDRAATYAASINAVLGDMLGSGKDGKVWLAIGPGQTRSVIKALERETGFQRELECYERLEEFEVRQIQGLIIPRLLGSDAELLVIEIGLVMPPRLIDFAKAYLDFEPEFTPEVWADWEEDRSERFGARWNDASRFVRS